MHTSEGTGSENKILKRRWPKKLELLIKHPKTYKSSLEMPFNSPQLYPNVYK